jgi:radical SAM superfamily enzyme YgiQ (UPF0313 family)
MSSQILAKHDDNLRLLLILGPNRDVPPLAVAPNFMGRDFKYPPLGLLHLAAFVRCHRPAWQVKVLDCQNAANPQKTLEKALADFNPTVAGVPFFADSLAENLSICHKVRQLSPNTRIIAGGPHVFHYPREIASLPGVDWAVRGEGEKPLAALLDFISQNGVGNPDIPGVYCKHGERVVGQSCGIQEEDLDNLPHPDRSMLPFRRYFIMTGRRAFCTTCMTSRGCCFSCAFCDVPYKSIRFHSPEWVLQDVKNCMDLGIREIHFYDDNFNLNPERASTIASMMSRQMLNPDWTFRGRVDCLDPAMLKAAKKAGCYRVYLGLESGTDRILKAMNKQITVSDIKKGVAAAKKAGLEVHGYFMIGFGDETRQEIEQTIDFACSLGIDLASFMVTAYYPGAPIYADATENGLLKEDLWLKQTKNPLPDFAPPIPAWFTLGQKEIWRLNALAYRRFYLKPQAIWRTGKSIRSPQALARRARGLWRTLQMTAKSFG